MKIGFNLNRRFGALEQAIFKLVLAGLKDTRQISALLWIFSDEVIANAMLKLVNEQVLSANIEEFKLELSQYIIILAEACENQTFHFTLPELPEGKLIITDDYKIKETIIKQLVSEFNMGFLVRLLDFEVYESGDDYEK